MNNHKSNSISATQFVLTGICSAILLSGCGAVKLSEKTDTQFRATMERASTITPEGPTIGQQAGNMVKGGKAAADLAANAQRVMPIGRRAAAPYIGSMMVPATSEDRLPTIFSEPFTLDFSDAAQFSPTTGQGTVSLQTAMARLSKLTGVSIRVQQDVFSNPSSGAAGGVAAPGSFQLNAMPSPSVVSAPSPLLVNSPMQKPAGSGVMATPRISSLGDDSVTNTSPLTAMNVDMRYSGTLAGYLNSVTDRLGLSWEYRDSTIVIMKYVTEMHELFTFPGTQKFTFSSSGSGSGSGGGGGASNAASASLSVDEAGDLAPLATIEKAIAGMIGEVPGSTVLRTDGSGRMMVKTSREMQSRVRDYIKGENNAMRRQAQIQFDIYSVTIDEKDERGINWSTIIEQAGQAAQIKIGTPPSLASALAGTAQLNILGGNGVSQILGDSSAMMQALHSNGYSAQHRPVSLLALNRQWGRISRLSTEYYLSETTPGPASSTGNGAPGLKTDKVTTGDQYVAMPQILDDNTVLLKFGMSLSDLLGLFDVSVGSGTQQQKVQAPKITAVNAQFPVALRPGEVVAVTGLSRMVSASDGRRMSEEAPMVFGGSDSKAYKREHFIVFIRPVIM